MKNLASLRRALRVLLPAAAAVLLALPSAAEEKSLLTPDGILYHVQSGLYKTFDPSGTAAQPDDYVIRWESRSQSGELLSGIIPGTSSESVKDQFDIAYDALTQSLFLVWNDRVSLINSVEFAVYQKGIWTQSQLLPSGVFSFANHPQILITHQTVQELDSNGAEIDTPRSVISVVWWEASAKPHARFAPIFLENGSIDLSTIQIYDLPELTGSSSVVVPSVLQNPLYKNPSLQQDGFSSGVVATFGDAATDNLRVVRIGFPSDFRGNLTPLGGRHSIVILGQSSLSMPAAVPSSPTVLGSIVGGGYQPTVYWQSDDSSVSYTVAAGGAWGDVRSVALTPTLGTNAALALISQMATQN
ncbi:MAG: hypothetical protein ACRD16_12375 [Thermoanaerobaculia bacterium]